MPSLLREVCNRCCTERSPNPGLCAHCGYDQFTWVNPLTRFTRWLASPFTQRAAPEAGVDDTPQHQHLTDASLPETHHSGAQGALTSSPAPAAHPSSNPGPWNLPPILLGQGQAALFLHPAAWVVLPGLAALIFGSQASRAYSQWPLFALALVLVPAAIIYFNWQSVAAWLRSIYPPSLHLHWGWVLVGFAMAVRIALNELLPLPQPIFEEVETGKWAYDIKALGHSLPIEFRMTNLFGALGFAIGDYNLDSLRLPFKLASALSILIMALTLRRLSISWPATIFVVFTMASLRFLVIGGGIADELFTGTLFAVALLYCLAASHTSDHRYAGWAALAGFFAGILFYEYISYKIFIIIPPFWWLLQAIRSNNETTRRAALLSAAAFILCFTVIALPAIYEVVTRPSSNIIFSGVFRHIRDSNLGVDTNASFNLAVWLWDAATQLTQYFRQLFGWGDHLSPAAYKTPQGSVILTLIGVIFAASFIYALWRPGIGGLARIAALFVIAFLLIDTVITFHSNTGRLVPIVLLLVLMTGLAADSALKMLANFRIPLFRTAHVCALILAAIVTVAGIVSTLQLARHPASLDAYLHAHYNVCRAIGQESATFHSVLMKTAHTECPPDHFQWLFPNAKVDAVSRVPDLPNPEQLSSGTLVVLGDYQGLSGNQIDDFINLASSVDSSHTFSALTNIQGQVSATSFCYQCLTDGGASPPIIFDSNSVRLEPNPEETLFQVGEDITFALATDSASDIWVALNPPGTSGSKFIHPQLGVDCPAAPENFGVYRVNEDTVTVRACEPGEGYIWLYLAGTETVIQQYQVRVIPSEGALGESDFLILPDPTGLVIHAAPEEHQPVHLVADESLVLVPAPDSSLVIHNNPNLKERDVCRELDRGPEGDTRLYMIAPEPGRELPSLFYLVGCAPGEAVLHVVSGNELLHSYTINIAEP